MDKEEEALITASEKALQLVFVKMLGKPIHMYLHNELGVFREALLKAGYAIQKTEIDNV